MVAGFLADPSAEKALWAVIGIAIVLAAAGLLRRLAGRHIDSVEIRYRVRKLISFVGYLLAALVALSAFSDRLASWSVAVGVVGAGIAFALQEVIASAAGWLAISAGGFYATGDRVQVGGIRGDVIDIGVFRTTLMEVGEWVKADQYSGRIVRVANSMVFKEPVFNYSADFPFLWDEIVFPLRYGSDWREARAMPERVVSDVIGDYPGRSRDAWKTVVRKYRIEDAPIDPIVSMRADQNWIEFTVRFIVDYRRRSTIKDRLFTRILEEVDASEGRIAIATAGFEVLSAPPLEVRVSQADQPLKRSSD